MWLPAVGDAFLPGLRTHAQAAPAAPTKRTEARPSGAQGAPRGRRLRPAGGDLGTRPGPLGPAFPVSPRSNGQGGATPRPPEDAPHDPQAPSWDGGLFSRP